jgi:GNAT superfamily N-acetyltransferase
MRVISQESDELRIRRGSDADLDPLVAVFRAERSFFGDCLAKQRAGGGVLLVAWLDGWPVGDVFLDRDPAEEPEIRRWLPGVPRLNHLEVLGPVQRRGIGTALLRAGEATTRKLGHRRVALGVGVDNPGARRLYERLGYTDWGHGSIVGSYYGGGQRVWALRRLSRANENWHHPI